MSELNFILKGHICYSKDKNTIIYEADGYLACEDGISAGVYQEIPEKYRDFPVKDYGTALIVPGLTDLHIHAPQYSNRGMGMDLELLKWLTACTFPEEAKYADMEYAKKAYSIFVHDLKYGATTRACIFATLHVPATLLLMDMLEETGLKTMCGKVSMDRNAPDNLREENARVAAEDLDRWLKKARGSYKNVKPILTPRFIPSCTDRLMKRLKELQTEYDLPVQSHLSENPEEIAWVRELCPWSASYGDAYDQFGLFGGDVKTVMAHCVHPSEGEFELMRKREIMIAHCPQSNTNLASGIAPVRAYLDAGMKVGLGSDVAGGSQASIFRAMSDAIQVSKLRWRLLNETQKPLSVAEAFWLGTAGGGEFFGRVGSFARGYELDAVVLDDRRLTCPKDLMPIERLERLIYLSEERDIISKYVAGRKVI